MMVILCISAYATSRVQPNTILICIDKSKPNFQITIDDRIASTNDDELNQILREYNISSIGKWLNAATENDIDGNINLNNIYRVKIDGLNQMSKNTIMNDLRNLPIIQAVEEEPIIQTFYTPNDTYYQSNNQCGLRTINADNAWDIWNIHHILPSDKSVLLASVDSGVDYTHPDLVNNIWINQSEIPLSLFNLIDSNLDNFITSAELIYYLSDYNSDGSINLKDAVAFGSPLLDGIDSDQNGFIDDIIGWDASGNTSIDAITAIPDNNPFPDYTSGDWSHGTHVAGILGATTDNGQGIASAAFDVKIIPVKGARLNSEDNSSTLYDTYDGMLYAAKAGFHADTFTIINCSWGSDLGNSFTISNFQNSVINVIHNTYGAIIVAAAGNGAQDEDGNWIEEEAYAEFYPASFENVISVSPLDCDGNWGGWATYHPTVDIAAPGEQIMSTVINGAYQAWNGSSMASPMVASSLGLLKIFYPYLSNIELTELLLESADASIYAIPSNIPYSTCNGNVGNNCLGVGIVNLSAALPEELVFYGCTNETACNFDSSDNIQCKNNLDNCIDDGGCLAMDCANECGGILTEDQCGVCGGNGPSIECSDNTFMCNPDACEKVKPSPNFPNPFETSTSITFYTKEADSGNFTVYDIIGNVITSNSWTNDEKEYNTISWDGSGASSGVYFYKIESKKGMNFRGKMVLVK
ncbi:MAG: S8 family peptidase [Candidatus Marinimicrobia bacterium]|nr:S8 family peptidase [Candidatus Neomarinimicrobiota bacterium]